MGSKVLVIGSLNMDFTAKSKRLPRKGETILAHDFKMSPGGKGANQAVAASKLGAEVDFIGRIGDDFIGEKILENLKHRKVAVEGIKEDSGSHSGIALIMVDDRGENIITVASGTNMRVDKQDIDENIELIKKADVVLFQLEIPVETVTYAASKIKDSKLILNPAPAKELPEELLENLDIIAPNEKEAEFLSGVEVNSVEAAKRAGRRLLEKGVGAVIVTLGAQGAVTVNHEGVSHIEAPNIRAVDTTGAGDAFCGALARYLSNKGFRKASEFAVFAGALATTEMGAQQALPTEEELNRFLEK